MTPYSEVLRTRDRACAAFTIVESLAMLVAIGILSWVLLAILKHDGFGPFAEGNAAAAGTAIESHEVHGAAGESSSQGKDRP